MQALNGGDLKREEVEAVTVAEASRNSARIACVIVTYRPMHEPLLREIEAIRPQVDDIIIVDNGDGSDLPDLQAQPDVEIISLGDNLGIARAQNVAIGRARAKGADHVLLLDQDSLPDADMVAKLLHGLRQLQQAGVSVAAVGPQYRDDRQQAVSAFVYRDGAALKEHVTQPPEHASVQAEFLIASGCLIPADVLDRVGLMDETLFIDYVDIEWGLRATQFGYASYGIPAAGMKHNLGDDWIVHKGRRFPVHSPLRRYYYTRNSILLARLPWIGWPWRLILLRRVIKQFVFFGFVAPVRRWDNMWMMTLGMVHGLIGRRGKK